jgi:hypothetical protein
MSVCGSSLLMRYIWDRSLFSCRSNLFYSLYACFPQYYSYLGSPSLQYIYIYIFLPVASQMLRIVGNFHFFFTLLCRYNFTLFYLNVLIVISFLYIFSSSSFPPSLLICSFFGGGVRLSPLDTSPTNWPIAPVPDGRWWMWSSQWNENWQGKPKYFEKTYSSATFSTINPTLPDLSSNPVYHNGKPATNSLSYSKPPPPSSYALLERSLADLFHLFTTLY